MEDTQTVNAHDVLEQIGWFRTDRNFLSLNLTDEQLDVLNSAVISGGGRSIEEVIVSAVARSLEDI